MSATKVKIPDKQEIHKICILAWGMVGDTLLRTAFVGPLKKHFPAARICVVVDSRGKGLFDHNPEVDEVYEFYHAKKPKWRYLSNIFKLVCWLRNHDFDLLINFYSGGSSPVITKLSGAKWRLGFDHTAKLRWANNILAPKASFEGHWIRALGETLRPLGIQEHHIIHRPFFFCSSSDRLFAKEFLASLSHKWVVFNMGASELRKCWPVEQHVALASWLYQEYGYVPLVLTNPGQEFLVETFKTHYPKHYPVKYVPIIPFGQIAALFEQSQFVVTGDTGLMHLAFGVQAPVLGLFTYTQPGHVIPEGGICMACFKPDHSHKDEYGQALGSQLDFSTVQAAAKQLVAML